MASATSASASSFGSSKSEGVLGIVYVCGEKTRGRLERVDALLGKKIKGLYGRTSHVVALVDKWELQWIDAGPTATGAKAISSIREQAKVQDALQDVKLQQLAFGKAHRAALTLDGDVFTWGTTNATFACGELGQALQDTPIKRSASATRSQNPEAQLHESSSKSLMSSARPSTSGSGVGGGGGFDVCEPRRVRVANDLLFTKVACGASHTAAIARSGDLYTWGRNFEGQLGHFIRTAPTETNTLQQGLCPWPKYVSAFLAKPRVVDVDCGAHFTVVLLQDGSVHSFGERFTGVTGEVRARERVDARPHCVLPRGTDGAPFVGIACGSAHSLAVTSSGQLYAWGTNSYGQLGLGHGDHHSTMQPHRVTTPPDTVWARVFAGGQYSAAVDNQQQLFTWGINHYGNLAHATTVSEPQHARCEFTPRRVDALLDVVVTTAVCAQRTMFAFAPSFVASLNPPCGEIGGGYELRLRGSGFWDAEDLTVRFIPLLEGRLVRGSLGRFDAATREVVCEVPKFSLHGDFAVEVAMNGKHFTTNGRVFEAFRLPQVSVVSIHDARLAGGDVLDLTLDGIIPLACRAPVLRFRPCEVDEDTGNVRLLDADAELSEPWPVVQAEGKATIAKDKDSAHAAEGNTHYIERTYHMTCVLPAVAPRTQPQLCVIEVSYNNGVHFAPIVLHESHHHRRHQEHQKLGNHDSTTGAADEFAHLDGKRQPSTIYFHDAHVVRAVPNTLLVDQLPETIDVHVTHLLTHPLDQLSVQLVVRPLVENAKAVDVATVDLPICSVAPDVITCAVPPLDDWRSPDTHKQAAQMAELQGLMNDDMAALMRPRWWRQQLKWGFHAALRVSMIATRSLLPPMDAYATKVFGLLALGNLVQLGPVLGPATGGTTITLDADFLHYDTNDVVVAFQYKDTSATAPGRCQPKIGPNGALTDQREIVCVAPAFPFGGQDADKDQAPDASATAMTVQVTVALDGVNFAQSSLEFTFYAPPLLVDVHPEEGLAGTHMAIKLDRLTISKNALVQLMVPSTGFTMVVPAETHEAHHTVEFALPTLPLTKDERVRVAVALNGQQFADRTVRDEQHSNGSGHGGATEGDMRASDSNKSLPPAKTPTSSATALGMPAAPGLYLTYKVAADAVNPTAT
ncbi:TPA: hypothetical protein N0F65_000503 [Lagenidium giganteum]|uniref:RCC1-like domain-containing protein n=1 Tax=Lagenidium giganteum TaxID=4803 RepID=A0AAV2YX83_9STRA|nr:TPA: hypothetical protein N0F65_000503 [Lagenidium giganteum]